MPLITEEDYILFANALNDPAIKPEESLDFSKIMDNYEAQQKRLGLLLTPSLDKQDEQFNREQSNSRNKNIQSIDNNLKDVNTLKDEIPESDWSTLDDAAKYDQVNKKFFKMYYKEYNPEQLELYKGDWMQKNNLKSPDSAAIYNSIKDYRNKENKKTQIQKATYDAAYNSVITDEKLLDGVSKFEQLKSSSTDSDFSVNEFIKQRNNIARVLNPYKSEANAVITSLFNKGSGVADENDQKTINEFFTKLKDQPEEIQSTVLSFLNGKAKQMGEISKNVQEKASGYDVFRKSLVSSVKDIFASGFTGISNQTVEIALDMVDTTSKNAVYAIKGEIDTPEKAKQFVSELANKNIRETLGSDVPVVSDQFSIFDPEAKGRNLNSVEKQLIEKELKAVKKSINIDRTVTNIEKNTTPTLNFSEDGSLAGTFGSTIGSSGALLGVAAVGGIGGTVLSTQLYAGMEYEDLRNQYPDMTPSDAANVALVSGALQGALDRLTIGTTKMAFGGFKTSLKEGVVRGGVSYVGENLIEAGQDISTPIVQELLGTLSSSMPEVNWTSEWDKFKNTRLDVAIGLLPLVGLGASVSTTTNYFNNRKIFNEDIVQEKLEILGMSKESIDKVIEVKNTGSITDTINTYREEYAKIVPVTTDGKTIQTETSINALREITRVKNLRQQAVDLELVSPFESEIVDGVETFYTARNNEKINLGTDRVAAQSTYKNILDEVLNEESYTFNEGVEGVIKGAIPVNNFNLDKENAKAAIIAEISGVSREALNKVDRIFGSQIQRKELINKLSNILALDPKQRTKELKKLSNKIFDKLDPSVQESFGRTVQEQKTNFLNTFAGRSKNNPMGKADEILFESVDYNEAMRKNLITSDQLFDLKRFSEATPKGKKPQRYIPVKLSKEFLDEGSGTAKEFVKIVNALKSIFKVNVVMFAADSGNHSDFGGVYVRESNTIYLDVNSEMPLAYLLGHEFTHSLQDNKADIYKKLKDYIIATIGENKLKELRGELNDNVYKSDDIKDDEIVADVVAERMFQPEFIEKLYKEDKTLFQTLYEGIIQYIKEVRIKITPLLNRYGQSIIDQNLDEVDTVLAEILSSASKSPFVLGFTNLDSFFQNYKASPNSIGNYAVNLFKNIVKAAKQNTEAVEGSIELPNITDNDIVNDINEYTKQLETISIPDAFIVEEGIFIDLIPTFLEDFKTFQKDIFSKFKSQFQAVTKTNSISDSVLLKALAVTGETKTLLEIDNLSLQEKSDIVKKALEKIDNIYKKGLIQKLRYTITEKSSNEAFNQTSQLFNEVIDLSKSEVNDRIRNVRDALFDADGIPRVGNEVDFLDALSGKDYNGNLKRLYFLKTFSNLENKSAKQLEDAVEYIDRYFSNVNSVKTFEDEITESKANVASELASSEILKKEKAKKLKKAGKPSGWNWFGLRPWLINLNNIKGTFLDSHLTFASMLELLSPTKDSSVILNQIQSKIASGMNVNDPEIVKLRNNLGKGATAGLQKIIDDLQNGFFTVQGQTQESSEQYIEDIQKAFNITGRKTVNTIQAREKAFESATVKSFEITVDGNKMFITPAQAALIANIADMDVYSKALESQGLTVDEVKRIKDILAIEHTELNTLRVQLRDRVKEEYEKTKAAYESVFGFAPPSLPNNFFPTPFRQTGIALFNSYDITFQSGNIDSTIDEATNLSEKELDLDLENSGNNLLTAYNFYKTNSIYRRNIYKPLILAKSVLGDAEVIKTIDESYGKEFRESLFKQLTAFDTNGFKDTVFDAKTTQYLYKALSAGSKGALGFNLRTALLNITSAVTAFQDTSLSGRAVLKGIGKAFYSIRGTKLNNENIYGIVKSPEIQQRINAGINALVALSKNIESISAPPSSSLGWLSPTRLSENAYELMSAVDKLSSSFAALAAYHAHYDTAQASGITDTVELENIAREGMRRTMLKTLQPNLISGKSAIETSNNAFLKFVSMFISEARKNIGLEITVANKAVRGQSSAKEVARILAVNHLLIGGLSWLIRTSISDMLKPEEEDDDIWNPASAGYDILLGPLSGIIFIGDVGRSVYNKIYNAFYDAAGLQPENGLTKIQDYPSSNMINRAVSSVVRLKKLAGDEELEDREIIDIIDNGIGGMSVLTGSARLTGIEVGANIINQLFDIVGAQED